MGMPPCLFGLLLISPDSGKTVMWFEFSLWNSFEVPAYFVLSLGVNMAGGGVGGIFLCR